MISTTLELNPAPQPRRTRCPVADEAPKSSVAVRGREEQDVGPARCNRMTTRTLSSDALFVEVSGSGPRVLYLHGLGASSRYWQRVVDASPPHLAVRPDLLGFGRSPKPPEACYDVDCHLATL